MELHSRLPYSEKWDQLLNKLIDEGEIIGHSSYTVDFKLQIGVESKGFLIKRQVPIFKIYSVWISNKDSHYARLWKVDGDQLPDNDQRSPLMNTMERLHELEQSLISEKWYEI